MYVDQDYRKILNQSEFSAYLLPFFPLNIIKEIKTKYKKKKVKEKLTFIALQRCTRFAETLQLSLYSLLLSYCSSKLPFSNSPTTSFYRK